MEKRAILIIHGFSGNEEEILYLHNYLKGNQLDSFWIQLTGHDGNRKGFSKATYKEWIRDVERKLDELEKKYTSVTCIGFSMGGLLTIQLVERSIIDQVILCNTPIYLYNTPVIVKDILKGIIDKKKENLNYYFNSATQISMHACLQFLSLLQKTKKKLSNQLLLNPEKKVLIVQNKEDETTYYKSAFYIAKGIQGQVIVKIYEGGRHQLFLGENKENVAKDIKKFIVS